MQNIAEILVKHNIVKTNFKIPFVWVSGIHSPIYCDCRELISIPKAREKIVNAFVDLISRENFPADIISGTATAGIPWAAFVADKSKPTVVILRPNANAKGRPTYPKPTTATVFSFKVITSLIDGNRVIFLISKGI